MSESAPPRIGRYRIDGVLGEGAMAVVYAGFDPQIERPLAIKCLHAEVAGDAAQRERFLSEARAAGYLVHPHIVTIFDSGQTDDGRAYIAMERLSGESLAQRVAQHGLPPLPVVLQLVTQLASALDYAHAQGVIHHDIKPDNIMLSDGWQHAKLADFGIAQRGIAEASAQIGGTPVYMAPERLRGDGGDARGDLFSLGVLLFWLLSGKLPWAYDGDLARLTRQRGRLPLPPLKPRDPATPPMLLELVRTLMAPEPSQRYQRGAEVIEDLQLLRRQLERNSEGAAPSRLHSMWLRWAALLGLTLAGVLLLGMLVIYSRQGAAVNGLARDFGASLGHMVASDAAENLLLGDKAGTRALVQDVGRNQQIDYLAIAGRDGAIIASTHVDQVGQPLAPAGHDDAQQRSDGIATFRVHGAGVADTLMFDVPIRYQDKQVGALRLGVSAAPLRTAQRTAIGVIAAVLVASLLAVWLVAFGLFSRLRQAFGVLTAAHMRVLHGDFGHRIRLNRRDEVGRLYASFNVMNEALAARGEPAPEQAVIVPASPVHPTELITPLSPESPAQATRS